eukprot:3166687-Rhodomonas_salina.3
MQRKTVLYLENEEAKEVRVYFGVEFRAFLVQAYPAESKASTRVPGTNCTAKGVLFAEHPSSVRHTV